MLGATATLIMAGLGMAGNAVKAVRANKQQKEAQSAAKQYANDIKKVKETNYMEGLQSADISKLAFEQQSRNTAQMTQALQEMGPEGAAQATGVVSAGNEAALETAQAQGVQDMSVQNKILSTEQEIEERRANRETGVAAMGLEGAQKASADAGTRRDEAITGMFDMAGLGIQGADDLISLYRKKKNQDFWSAEDNAIFDELD